MASTQPLLTWVEAARLIATDTTCKQFYISSHHPTYHESSSFLPARRRDNAIYIRGCHDFQIDLDRDLTASAAFNQVLDSTHFIPQIISVQAPRQRLLSADIETCRTENTGISGLGRIEFSFPTLYCPQTPNCGISYVSYFLSVESQKLRQLFRIEMAIISFRYVGISESLTTQHVRLKIKAMLAKARATVGMY